MEREQVRKFLDFYDKQLVLYAVSLANLSPPEWATIYLRELHDETIESTAERLGVSVTTVKTRYNAGMDKLCACWSGLRWVAKLIE